MKMVFVMLLILATTGLALAADLLRSRTGETARATDLLRAERMAEEAQRRLALPRRKTARWLRGGTDWTGHAAREPADGSPPIILNVRPPRPPSRRR